jgi:hypothetical protein
MKKTIAFAFALMTISVMSCTNNGQEGISPTHSSARTAASSAAVAPNNLTSVLPANDPALVLPAFVAWTVRGYIQKGVEILPQFDGFSLAFSANGGVVATDSKGKTTTGTWVFTPGSGFVNGVQAVAATFTMDFGKSGKKPLAFMNRTWEARIISEPGVLFINPDPLANESFVLMHL